MSEQAPEQVKADDPELEPADDYPEAATPPDVSPVQLDVDEPTDQEAPC